MKTYNSITKFATGQGDDYTVGCFVDYPYFKKHYKLTAIDLSKQQKLDVDLKGTQQIKFTENPEKNVTISFRNI